MDAGRDALPRRGRLPRSIDPMSLPLFWKLLLPFLALLVVIGTAGTFVVMRDLGSRTQTRLDQDLSRRLVEARSLVTDRELYLLESANFASNIQGMDVALRRGDRAGAARLLESVAALKSDLGLLAVTDRSAETFVAFRRAEPAGPLTTGIGAAAVASLVETVLSDSTGRKSAAFIDAGSKTILAIAAPICSATATCDASGATVVGIDLPVIARAAAGVKGGSDISGEGVTIFAVDGEQLAAVGTSPSRRPPSSSNGELVRVGSSINGTKVATAYAPLTIQGERRGTIAVTLPTDPAFASVRDAAYRLAMIVLVAMIGVVALGALLSKYILGQVAPLLSTSRALGQGNLDARVAVVADDELGELGRGMNQMADELQASHRNLESRVDQRTAEVQRLMQERSNFFAMLSHELRTPLAIILNQADLFDDTSAPLDRKSAAEAADAIRQSGTQVLTLVNDILEVARAEAGRLEVSIGVVDLAATLSRAEPTLRGLAGARDISFRLKAPKTLPCVLADPERLREVVLNLVDNAVKYTPSGGTVEVVAETVGDRVEIRVSDTGVGIPADVGEAIFEPFYRVKDTRTQHGEPSTGLGLALSHRLMTVQSGSLSYLSSADGTVFTASIPVAADGAKPPRPKSPARPRRATASAARS